MGKVVDGIGPLIFWSPRERSFIYGYPNKPSCLIVSVVDAKLSCLIVFYVKEEGKHMYL
jgi:hypothetical protein